MWVTCEEEAVKAVCAAYDAAGVMLSKTHLDEHVELIRRYGLAIWRQGFRAAQTAGKHNVPRYVARCVESIALKRENKHDRGKYDNRRQGDIASTAEQHYREQNKPEVIAALRAEWDNAHGA